MERTKTIVPDTEDHVDHLSASGDQQQEDNVSLQTEEDFGFEQVHTQSSLVKPRPDAPTLHFSLGTFLSARTQAFPFLLESASKREQ